MTVSQRQFRYPGESLPALPFASLPPASSVPWQTRRVPELNNAELVSNGTLWIPNGGRQMIRRLSVPVGPAPTGSVAANGAVTLGTALNTTFSQGLWLYYPAGAVYAGSLAGFYWTVMSSTTLGTIYNNTYNPTTDTGTPPTSPTAIVAAGPGAYAGTTATVTVLSINIPGGLIHTQGGIASYCRLSTNNTAGSKATLAGYGGVNYSSASFASNQVVSKEHSFNNLGVANIQGSAGWGDGSAANISGIFAVDSAVAQAATMSLRSVTAATDVVIAIGMTVDLLG